MSSKTSSMDGVEAANNVYATSKYGCSSGNDPFGPDVPGVEDQVGLVVARMSYHVYSLGEGIIGRVAFTGKHQWVFGTVDKGTTAEGHGSGRLGARSMQEKYPAGWQQQFTAGIKTIAVVAVPQGVVQLGSTQTIMEDLTLCSIDVLLERTIKHMHFLQSVTQLGGKWTHSKDWKEQDTEARTSPIEDLDNGESVGIDFGVQSRVCPIVVEDLNEPRKMLIEMLCGDKDLFLEIADTVRGLGFSILKGSTEHRGSKTWARFIVEATRDVHRVEVLWSLMQLFQASNIDSSAANYSRGIQVQDNTSSPSSYPLFQPPTHLPMAGRLI